MSLWQCWRDLRTYYRGCRGQDLRAFYDLESRLPYFDHAGHVLGAHKRRVLQRWVSAAPVHGPILELGGGVGTFARQLGRRGYQVISIDISPAKTLKAQYLTARHAATLAAPVHHVVGDVRTLGSGTALDQHIQDVCQWHTLRPFDVLLAADVLEHLPEPPTQTLHHLRTLLAPHGRFFTSVPAPLWRHDPGHFWPILPTDWEQAFTATGWQIQRQQMSRLCWYGLPMPLPLAMVYELRLLPAASGQEDAGTPGVPVETSA